MTRSTASELASGIASESASEFASEFASERASGPAPRPGAIVVVTIGGVLALAAYLVALHVLIVDGDQPPLTLALIAAPWLIAAASALVRRRFASALAMLAVVGLVAVVAWILRRDLAGHVAALLYLENLVFVLSLAALFAQSVARGRDPLVSKLARVVRRGDMPPAVMRYTRRVTIAWAAFFVAVAALSTVLFFGTSRETWSAFVNLAQWPLVIVAFALEYAVRVVLLRDIRHSSPVAGFRAYLQGDALATGRPDPGER